MQTAHNLDHGHAIPESRSATLAPNDQALLPAEFLRAEAGVLLVGDDPGVALNVQQQLSGHFRHIQRVADMSDALDQLRAQPHQVVVIDLAAAPADGADDPRLTLCSYLAANRPDVAVVVVCPEGDMRRGVEAMRAGAFDLVTLPVRNDALRRIVVRAASQALLESRLHRIEDTALEVSNTQILGESAPVRRMLEQIARVANTDVTVLITGDSGTGKELVARAMHQQSDRRGQPFIPVNCAAIPGELLEAELFGHAKGAFTDAKKSKDGLFVRAEGGTLFLDEVGEMPPEMQVKLLRALQERRVRPVGGTAEVDFDVRLVAATNRDLEADVAAGQFREDLYYRLNVVRIETPPLRERGEDVLLLAQHFVRNWAEHMNKEVSGISAEAAQRLLAHTWPGNVRELENVIQRAVALSRFDELHPADLGELGVPTHTAQPAAPTQPRAAAPATPAPMQTPVGHPMAHPTAHQPVAQATYQQPRQQPGQQPRQQPGQPMQTMPYGQPVAARPQPMPATPADPRMAPRVGGWNPPAAQPAGMNPGMQPGAMGSPEQYDLDGLRRWLRTMLDRADLDATDPVPALEDLETVYIQEMLRACGGNKTRSAQLLGMARRTLYRRLKQIEPAAKAGDGSTVGSATAPGGDPANPASVSQDII